MTDGEQRKWRSFYKDISLQRWLQSVAQRNNAQSMAVANSAGLLVATDAPRSEVEEIAAISAQKASPDGAETIVDYNGSSLVICSVKWNDEILFLSAQGELSKSRAAIQEAREGVLRILSNS